MMAGSVLIPQEIPISANGWLGAKYPNGTWNAAYQWSGTIAFASGSVLSQFSGYNQAVSINLPALPSGLTVTQFYADFMPYNWGGAVLSKVMLSSSTNTLVNFNCVILGTGGNAVNVTARVWARASGTWTA
jgi:hypothetical protein